MARRELEDPRRVVPDPLRNGVIALHTKASGATLGGAVQLPYVRTRLVACLLWLATSSLAAAQAPSKWATRLPRPTEYRLPNGLEVVLAPLPRSDRVLVATSYHVGARDDPSGYVGLAHLVEHLTFRGSRHVRDGDFARFIHRAGGDYNGYTTADHTVYITELPATQLPLGLWLESERMAFTLAELDPEVLEIERRVVRAEWDERRGDFQGSRLAELITQASYPPSHPYFHSRDLAQGTDDASADAVRWFYEAYYRPDNARLIIAGHFDEAQVRTLIERYFGPVLPRGASHPRAPAEAVLFDGIQHVTLRAPRHHPFIAIRFRVPRTDAASDLELSVLARYLSHGDDSPLSRTFERSGHLASESGAFVEEAERHSTLIVWAEAAAGISAEDLERAMWRALGREDTDISAERLQQIRLGMAADLVTDVQNAWDVVWSIAKARPGQQPPYVNDQLATLEQLTPARLREVSRSALSRSRALVTIEAPRRNAGEGRITDVEGELRLRTLSGGRP